MPPIYKSTLAHFLYASVLMPSFGVAAPAPTAGTLTCTLKPEPDLEHSIACNYRPVGGGAEAQFKGTVVRLGADTKLDSNRVLVWFVVGPPKLEPGELDGTFVRKNPSDSADPKLFKEALIGGEADQIALLPPSGREQIPGNAAVAIIELNLKSVRV